MALTLKAHTQGVTMKYNKCTLNSIARFAFAISSVLLIGCAPVTRSITPSTNINDFALMSTRQISNKPVKFSLICSLSDSIHPLNKDGNIINERFVYKIDIRGTISKMLNSWVEAKFASRSDSAKDKILIQIDAFSISEYCMDSESMQIAVGLSGGEVTNKVEAKIAAHITIQSGDSVIVKKNITTSSEDSYIVSVGTASSTNINLTENSREYRHAKNINNLMNKFIMLANAAVDPNNSASLGK